MNSIFQRMIDSTVAKGALMAVLTVGLRADTSDPVILRRGEGKELSCAVEGTGTINWSADPSDLVDLSPVPAHPHNIAVIGKKAGTGTLTAQVPFSTGCVAHKPVMVADIDLALSYLDDDRDNPDVNDMYPGGFAEIGGHYLETVALVVQSPVAGTVTLSAVSGGGNIQLYNSDGSSLTLPAAWSAGSQPAVVYAAGLKVGRTQLSLSFVGSYNGQEVRMEDRVNISAGQVDLTIDSNNDGKIDANDWPIEDVETQPGKVLFSNTLDSTGNGVPDYADGINLHGNEGDKRSSQFVPLKFTLRTPFPLANAKIKFDYVGADPSLVTNEEIPNSTVRHYAPGSDGRIRIWTKDGLLNRKIKGVHESGDYISPGTEVTADRIFALGQNTTTLYVEGINSTDVGGANSPTPIMVRVNASGLDWVYRGWDRVRASVSPLQIVYTDVTGGINGIGNTAAADVPRIPKDQEADGIACDWMTGVNDGAMLLMRMVTSPEAYQLVVDGKLNVVFRYIPETAPYDLTNLPVDPMRDGKYMNKTLSPDLGIEAVGGKYQNNERRIVAAQKLYRPPDEFDLVTPLNPKKERKVNLAVKVSGVLQMAGAKPNAIALVRPPLVLVHGVNSDKEMWDKGDTALLKQFDTNPADSNFGFICKDFRVDHGGVDPYRSDEEKTYGFGEISHMYELVRDMIYPVPNSEFGVTNDGISAKKAFFDGKAKEDATPYFESVETERKGKRIAVQKVDVVAHSYGGLLTRWYTEQSTEYPNRRDIRKLITLGTPHRGSPLANMVCETFKKGLIAYAKTHGHWSFEEVQVSDFLRDLDIAAGNGPKDPGEGLPNALDTTRSAPRHAYQTMSINSQRLNALNNSPLRNDVAYAAVIGTDVTIKVIVEKNGVKIPVYPNLYKVVQPTWNPENESEKFYFPWIYEFHKGDNDTDGIVPVWSARIGVESHNFPLEVNHVSMGNNETINSTVCAWLNGANPADPTQTLAVPLGKDQRVAFVANGVPKSAVNAYIGSTIQTDGSSKKSGLERYAIVKVELDSDDDSTGYGVRPIVEYQNGLPVFATPSFGTGPTEVGVRPSVLTGMIQSDQAEAAQTTFTIVADRDLDTTLHAMGKLASSELRLGGTGTGTDRVRYQITTGRIGRRHDQKLTGPDGSPLTSAAEDYVGYESAAVPDGQSPPTAVLLPAYVLPPPVKGGTNNLLLTLKGAVEAADSAQASQTSTVRVWSMKNGAKAVKLDEQAIVVEHDAGIWDGLLIRYSTRSRLRQKAGGEIVGPNGSAGQPPVAVSQELIEPEWLVDDPISESVEVP